MVRKGLGKSQKRVTCIGSGFGATSKEQEPNSVPPKRQLKPTGVVSGGKAYHPKRVAVWSSFAHSKGRQSKRDAYCSIAAYFCTAGKKDTKSWWIRFWEEVALALFPAHDHQDRYKRYQGEIGYWKRGFPGPGTFRVIPRNIYRLRYYEERCEYKC